MKCQKKADNCGNENGGSLEIELLDASIPAKISDSCAVWVFEIEENDTNGDYTKRKVDIETP